MAVEQCIFWERQSPDWRGEKRDSGEWHSQGKPVNEPETRACRFLEATADPSPIRRRRGWIRDDSAGEEVAEWPAFPVTIRPRRRGCGRRSLQRRKKLRLRRNFKDPTLKRLEHPHLLIFGSEQQIPHPSAGDAAGFGTTADSGDVENLDGG